MKCATHPNVETNLRCGKCGKLICPKCMVQTPVGARCPDCARLYELPTFRVSFGYYLRATGTALGMAIVSGVVWEVLNGLVPFIFLNLLLSSGIGYAIGEVVSLSVNRKRGKWLATIAGMALVISYLIRFLPWTLPLAHFHIFDLAALVLGVFFAVTRLR